MTVLDDIAREKNAVLIYQHENQKYEQFFEKLKRWRITKDGGSV